MIFKIQPRGQLKGLNATADCDGVDECCGIKWDFNDWFHTHSLQIYGEFQIFFIRYNKAISVRAPLAGVFGGRKQEDNRG